MLQGGAETLTSTRQRVFGILRYHVLVLAEEYVYKEVKTSAVRKLTHLSFS